MCIACGANAVSGQLNAFNNIFDIHEDMLTAAFGGFNNILNLLSILSPLDSQLSIKGGIAFLVFLVKVLHPLHQFLFGSSDIVRLGTRGCSDGRLLAFRLTFLLIYALKFTCGLKRLPLNGPYGVAVLMNSRTSGVRSSSILVALTHPR